jgi:D-alanyl-D-alanine carboxypeptidase/D-alanyl-D-alanine-endopeptidase (penicillin-binding protein 4)
VEEINLPRPQNARHFKSIPVDSLYKVMMEDSDNFIAEQLLLLCAGTVSDTLDSDIAIRYAKKNLLTDLPDNPIWVDGSGLSRYNLFTPRSIVRLWEKISEAVPSERLLPLLATGGKSGTIRNWYKADPPFIFAKTGSLSNNHSLSGFLITKKGKTLLFSFMNNHFTTSSNEVRREMEKILFTIRDRY